MNLSSLNLDEVKHEPIPTSWEELDGSHSSQTTYNRVDLFEFLDQHGIDKDNNDALLTFRALALRLDINLTNGAWIAGGSVLAMMDQRSMINRDVDMFFASKEQADAFENKVKKVIGWSDRVVTGNATTLTLSKAPFSNEALQIIRRQYFESVEEVLSTFDFSVCQWATDGTDLIYSDQALADWKTKTLRHVLKKREPDSIDRLTKYALTGYTPTDESAEMILEWLINDREFFIPTNGYP